MYITHAGSSSCLCGLDKLVELPIGRPPVAMHGVILSLSRTPRSRASCSRVMGRNEPIIVSTQLASPWDIEPYPWHRWRRPPPPSHNCTSLRVPFGSSGASLHLHTSALSGTPDGAIQGVHLARRPKTVRRLLQQMALARLGWLYPVILVSGEQACVQEGGLVEPSDRALVNWIIQPSILVVDEQSICFEMSVDHVGAASSSSCLPSRSGLWSLVALSMCSCQQHPWTKSKLGQPLTHPPPQLPSRLLHARQSPICHLSCNWKCQYHDLVGKSSEGRKEKRRRVGSSIAA